MGQANRRGTFEERKAKAIAKKQRETTLQLKELSVEQMRALESLELIIPAAAEKLPLPIKIGR